MVRWWNLSEESGLETKNLPAQDRSSVCLKLPPGDEISIEKGNEQRKYGLSLIKIQPNSLTYDKIEKKKNAKWSMSYCLNVKHDNRDTIHTTDLILILILFPLVGNQPGSKKL